jgi:hypothetical protein
MGCLSEHSGWPWLSLDKPLTFLSPCQVGQISPDQAGASHRTNGPAGFGVQRLVSQPLRILTPHVLCERGIAIKRLRGSSAIFAVIPILESWQDDGDTPGEGQNKIR